jgi:O-antigen ligase
MKVHHIVVQLTLLLVLINLQGIDPVDFIIPVAMVTSYVSSINKVEVNKIEGYIFLFFIVFSFFYVVSIIINDFKGTYVVNIALNIMLFLIVFRYATTDARVEKIMLWLSIGTTLSSILALLSFNYDVKIFADQFEVIRHNRFMSMFGDPNILAAYLVFLLIYWIDRVIYLKVRHNGSFMLGALFIVIFTFQILATGSRSAWVALVIGMVVYLFFSFLKYKSKLRVFSFIFIFLAVVFILIITGVGDVSERLDSIVNIDSSEADRFNLFYTASAIQVAIANPFGVGPGMTSFYTNQSNLDGLLIGSHNAFVQIFSDNGWIAGTTFFLLIIILWLKLFVNTIRGEVRLGISQSAMLGIFSSLIVVGMFQDLIQWKVIWVIMTLIVATLYSKYKFHTKYDAQYRIMSNKRKL